jgi:hypothetical protein
MLFYLHLVSGLSVVRGSVAGGSVVDFTKLPSTPMKLHLFRQDLPDYQDFFELAYLHPVDPAKNGKSMQLSLLFDQTGRPPAGKLFRLAAALTTDLSNLLIMGF